MCFSVFLADSTLKNGIRIPSSLVECINTDIHKWSVVNSNF